MLNFGSIPKNIATTRPLIDPQAGFRGRQDETSSSWKEVFFWSTFLKVSKQTLFSNGCYCNVPNFCSSCWTCMFPFCFQTFFFILRGFLCPSKQPSPVFRFLVFPTSSTSSHVVISRVNVIFCMFFGLKKWLALLHHRKLTWNLKRMPWKGRNIYKLPIFGFHVSFQGCIPWVWRKWEFVHHFGHTHLTQLLLLHFTMIVGTRVEL